MFDTRALRAICHPDAECMSDKTRIACFVEMGNKAADEIDRLHEELSTLRHPPSHIEAYRAE